MSMTDFERDRKKIFNRLLNFIPNRLKPFVLVVVIVGSIWGGIKFAPDIIERFQSLKANDSGQTGDVTVKSESVHSEYQSGGITAQTVNQSIFLNESRLDKETIKFFAQRMWNETRGNLKTLHNLLEGLKKNEKHVPPNFVYDAYNKHGHHLSRSKAAQQIINFYTNLKLVEGGTSYTPEMILETISQGQDAVNFLQMDFGFTDYFQGVHDRSRHAVSADATAVYRVGFEGNMAGEHVVSADLPMLTKPPYEAIGDIVPERNNDKSDL